MRSLYDLTTGSVKHDLKGYGDAIADSAWGARKTYGYQLANEALSIANRAGLSSTLTREQIQSLVDQVKK